MIQIQLIIHDDEGCAIDIGSIYIPEFSHSGLMHYKSVQGCRTDSLEVIRESNNVITFASVDDVLLTIVRINRPNIEQFQQDNSGVYEYGINYN